MTVTKGASGMEKGKKIAGHQRGANLVLKKGRGWGTNKSA